MLYFRWIAGTLLMAFFLLWIACNLVYVYEWFVHQRHGSLVIIVGGIAGLAGFLVLPVKALNDWFWVPLVADVGVLYGAALIFLAGKKLLRKLCSFWS